MPEHVRVQVGDAGLGAAPPHHLANAFTVMACRLLGPNHSAGSAASLCRPHTRRYRSSAAVVLAPNGNARGRRPLPMT